VRSGVSAVKWTSTSLAFSRSVSICHWGLMSQLDPIGRLVGQHARPAALAAVDAAVVDVAARARLEHGLGDVDAEHVVLARLDPVEVLREHAERALDRRLHDELVAHRGVLRVHGHETSLVGVSTSAL
jgi:hypothetical protein